MLFTTIGLSSLELLSNLSISLSFYAVCRTWWFRYRQRPNTTTLSPLAMAHQRDAAGATLKENSKKKLLVGDAITEFCLLFVKYRFPHCLFFYFPASKGDLRVGLIEKTSNPPSYDCQHDSLKTVSACWF